MKMSNLKVTLFFEEYSPLLINRYTTIDSILLSAYYGYKAKSGNPLPFDEEHKSVDFIHREHGVFSGSIWYIDKDQKIFYDFHQMIKNPEYTKIYHTLEHKKGAKVRTNSLYKQALIEEEIILTEKIHFYIRGSEAHIEALLVNEVKSVGMKQKLGFGKVKRVEIETIDEDKGYMLNDTTSSKPLPLSTFTLKSKKIAYFRPFTPYWMKDKQEACYMPTTALYELTDTTYDTKPAYKVAEDTAYVSNVDFIYQVASKFKAFKEVDESIMKIKCFPKKGDFFKFEDGKPMACSVSGDIEEKGVYGDVRNFLKKWKKSFSDYGNFGHDDFISHKTLWCIDNILPIGYSLVEKNQKDWVYLQGAKAVEDKRINQYIQKPGMFNPPFSINLKDTANAQHVSFKGKVSISTAFYYVQYGDSSLQIDTQMLMEAISDIKKYEKKFKNITKTHLCGNFKGAFHPQIKNSASIEERDCIENFHKKYDKNIRNYLNVVAF